MEEIRYEPIGVIHSSNEQPEGTPIQPRAAEGTKGEVEVYEEYLDALKDLEEFSHLILIYHFHKSGDSPLQVNQTFHG